MGKWYKVRKITPLTDGRKLIQLENGAILKVDKIEGLDLRE